MPCIDGYCIINFSDIPVMAALLSLWEREFIVMTAQILICASDASKTKRALGRECQICFFYCTI